MGDVIQDAIVSDVKASDFSIFTDEVTDISRWEQLGVTIRCARDNKAYEKLISFIVCTSITGQTAAELEGILANLGLDILHCSSQAYDGAGIWMAGKPGSTSSPHALLTTTAAATS